MNSRPSPAERVHRHGTRALWNVRKLDQLGALAITIRRLMT